MSRKTVLMLVALAALGAGCGRLGTGLPACRAPVSDPTAATVLSLQAVPEARYTPCLNALQVGWDEVEFKVERGLAKLEFTRDLDSFLNVSLTPSCDVGEATEVPSGVDGVRRFENITQVEDDIRVTIVPDGERPRIYALSLAAELEGIRLDDRPVVFTVDEDTSFPVRSRVNRAFFSDDFVWIIGDLDIDEETIEMRATPGGEGAHGLEVDEALDRIGDVSAAIQYRGWWYLVFDGGCISYDFDAEGTMARSIAEDAEATVGLYPADELRRTAHEAGFDLVDG